ncbi:hypothetical protein [Streptomyces sp. NPDC002403]
MELDESVLSLDVQDETAKTAQRYGGTHGEDNPLNTEPDQKDSLGLPRRALPTTTTGLGTGIMNFGGQVAGVVAPVAMGWPADTFSYSAAFGFFVITTLPTVVTALWVPQRVEQFTFPTAVAK